MLIDVQNVTSVKAHVEDITQYPAHVLVIQEHALDPQEYERMKKKGVYEIHNSNNFSRFTT